MDMDELAGIAAELEATHAAVVARQAAEAKHQKKERKAAEAAKRKEAESAQQAEDLAEQTAKLAVTPDLFESLAVDKFAYVAPAWR